MKDLCSFRAIPIVLGCIAVMSGSGETKAACLSPPGDVTGSGTTDVIDVQCGTLAVLWQIAGSSGPFPLCAAVSADDFDFNGSNFIDVIDLQIVIFWALGEQLDPVIDTDGNNCPDVLDAKVGCEALVCDDGNPCTTDGCDPESVTCTFAPNQAPCDDGQPCTTGDSCDGGVCGGTLMSCDDADVCTADSCVDGTCVHTLNPASCDNLCLLAGAGKACCDAICAVTPSCCAINYDLNCQQEQQSICSPCTTNCCPESGVPGCDNWVCQNCVCAMDPSCCNEGWDGACANKASNECAEECFVCISETCADGNPCTDDSCNPATGCVHTFNTAGCNDGNLCTINDSCQNGQCVGTPNNCDDGNPCTNNFCDSVIGCTFMAPGGGGCCAAKSSPGCGNAACQSCVCSFDPYCCDTMWDGICALEAESNCAPECVCDFIGCNDGNICTDYDHCQGATCVGGGTKSCFDGNPCTDDSCNPAAGCVHTFNILACDDNNPCTINDLCQGGTCSGVPTNCNDGNSCTVDMCTSDGAIGCFHTSIGAACNTSKSTPGCNNAACQSCICNFDPFCCDTEWDAQCAIWTSTTCESECDQFNVPCNDGDLCTINDYCEKDQCVGGGPQNCNDKNPCTVDMCTSGGAIGCFHTSIGAACNTSKSTPGCNNAACQSCICSFDPFCCDTEWDAQCAIWTSTTCESECSQYNVACNDGDACTINDYCENQQCVGVGLKNCDDGNPCTVDMCYPGFATGCFHTPIGAACNTTKSTPGCNNAACESCVCNTFAHCCDTQWDANCANFVSIGCKAECDQFNVPCDDGDACTINDYCEKDQCVGGGQKSCNDQNPCTTDSCLDGVCVHVGHGGPCDDGNACTTFDTCSSTFTCQGGGMISCTNDNNPCTVEKCHSSYGCISAAISVACNAAKGTPGCDNAACQSCVCGKDPFCCGAAWDGLCVSLASYECEPACAIIGSLGCDDNNLCTGNDKCLGKSCQPGPWPCNDGNPCTDDSCASAVGCAHTFNTLGCNDGNNCTTNDSCQNGSCTGTQKDCQDGNPCTDNVCFLGTGECVATAVSGDCSVAKSTPGCGNAACQSCVCSLDPFCCNTSWDVYCVGAAANPCAAACANGSVGCNDGNQCTANDHCQGTTCVGELGLVCEDANPCTDDSCNLATGCVHTYNTSGCNDGNPCTINDSCQNGSCVGTQKNCEDGNPCTDNFCIAGVGCVSSNNSVLCNDGNACTMIDKCNNGSCFGTPLICDDNNPCTTNGCSTGTGCTYTSISGGSCSDGNPCTTGDSCQNGQCIPTKTSCEDGNPCTDNFCIAGVGCTASNNTISCNDGNACTIIDKCNNGSCFGTPMICNDNNPCTVDSCNSATGCMYTATNFCGNGCCGANENSCNCPADCPDDPNTCSSCQCGGSGGNCWCDSDCVVFGDCCSNACGACGQCPPVCGNGSCQPGESCSNCPADCGLCSGGGGCTAKSTPGCGGCPCGSCVCGMDPYCCNTAWDGICVSECQGCGYKCP